MPLPRKTKATLGPCILVPQVVVEGSTQGRDMRGTFMERCTRIGEVFTSLMVLNSASARLFFFCLVGLDVQKLRVVERVFFTNVQ